MQGQHAVSGIVLSRVFVLVSVMPDGMTGLVPRLTIGVA